MKISRVLRDAFGRCNIEVMRSPSLPGRFMARQLAETLARYSVEVVIDVGANRGQFYDFLRDAVGWHGTIISFEPIASCYQEIYRRAQADPAWITMQLALGDSESQRKLNVMESSDFSSFLYPDPDSPICGDQNRVVDEELVEVRTLDSVMAALATQEKRGLGRVFLKLDTQGSELNVLRGAGETLRRTGVLLTELSFQRLYTGSPRWTEIVGFLEQAGFHPGGFFPVSLGDDCAAVEMDGLFVNPGIL